MDETSENLTKQEKRELAKQKKAEERETEIRNQVGKKWLVTLLAFAAIAFVGFKAWQFIMTPSSTPSQPIVVSDMDQVKGARDTKAVLIEYGDFECPACALYYPETKKLAQEFGDNVTIVYRHYPLIQIHKKALAAARASEAAGKQGKFWEMHDLLYEKQEEWVKAGNADEKFLEYAKTLGLDEQKFKEAYESDEVKNKINADIVSGNQLKVQGTPSFFLNGKKVQPRSYEDFKGLIDQALSE